MPLAAPFLSAGRLCRRMVGAAAGLFGLAVLLAGSEPMAWQEVANPTAPVILNPVTVHAFVRQYCPPFAPGEVTPPGFSARDLSLDFMTTYPGKAYADGVSGGRATVGVMLDAAGHPEDFLVIRYSQPYFGAELLRAARSMAYEPLRIKGSAVPGRFTVGYQFTPTMPIRTNAMFDVINEHLSRDLDGGARFIYRPYPEDQLENGQLESLRTAVPLLPHEYAAPRSASPRPTLVTFFVDEQGRVRLPTVVSAESPLLIPNAIKAIQHWQFRPPTIHGRPVLVFAARALPYQAEGAEPPPVNRR